MFIRTTKKKNINTGKTYISHQLVETRQTEKGPRNHVLLYLGSLDIERDQFKKLSRMFEKALSSVSENPSRLFRDFQNPEEAPLRAIVTAALEANRPENRVKGRKRKAGVPRPRGVAVLDPATIETEESRSLGAELLGHQSWTRMELDAVLTEEGFSLKERALAEALVVGRLVSPGSELHTHRWLSGRTALGDLLGKELLDVGKDALYTITDRLWEKKDRIESALARTTRELFPPDRFVFLYDLSNTYFEGTALGNDLAKRGHSKEKRSDCPLVSFSLVVDDRGHPVASRIDPGNQSEPETLPAVLDRLEKLEPLSLFPSAKPTIVMDRGIATRANVALLRARNFPYCIVERRPAAKAYQSLFATARETFDWFAPRPETPAEGVFLKKIPVDGSPEIVRVLVLSCGRKEKEEGMDSLKETRFVEALARLQGSIRKRTVTSYETALKRLGRLEGRFPSVAKYYTITPVALLPAVKTSPATSKKTGKTGPSSLGISDLAWVKNERREERKSLTGAYVIETTHTGLPAGDIWSLYTVLTQVEGAFRALKSDLGVRPVFHQKADRTRAHLFVSVLAYYLLSDIESRLRTQGDSRSWSTIRSLLSTHSRVTTTGVDPHTGVLHKIRHTLKPEPAHTEIFSSLGVTDPTRRVHTRILPEKATLTPAVPPQM